MRQPLHCDIDGEPFKECIVCGTDLMASPLPYYVERAQKRVGDTELLNTVFEYAICANCATDLFMEMSTESREAIERFTEEHRQDDIEELEPGELPRRCTFSGKTIDGMREWTECGMFVQGEPSPLVSPYLVSMEMTDELMELLSDETIEMLEDFKDKNLDLPPELKDLFDNKPVFIPL